ncbi:MAG: ATP-binding protein [bacterium]|nr:ATP-binding protein [bacterium]
MGRRLTLWEKVAYTSPARPGGIPPDALDTIFDEYRQVEGSDREHKGTGLGLSITKQFAELLGGSISVQNEIGRGSTFTVRVPVVYEEG